MATPRSRRTSHYACPTRPWTRSKRVFGEVVVDLDGASYYATPQIAFVEIDLPAMPSALVWRADDQRPILRELDALLLRIGRRYGIAPA